MTNSFVFGISLTASFLAGVLALFAPCCITFLFPSYLGTIFKEGKKVMFYTIVFALGLSFILVPVSLGLRFFIFFFDSYHQLVYYAGGLFLIFMGIMTVKPLFHIPQFLHVKSDLSKNVNTASVFGLGLVSGLTSACCAPVLFAAVALTTLSPTLIQALFVSLAYVLGIVFPLFILSLFYEKLTKKIAGRNREKIYTVFKFLGALIFILSGILIIVLAYLRKLEMYQTQEYSQSVRLFVFQIAKAFENPVLDILIFIGILVLFYKLLKHVKKED